MAFNFFYIMLTNIHYVLRSRQDGSYIAARPRPQSNGAQTDENQEKSANPRYLLLFQDYADGLTYLNTHAPDLADRFAVESVTQSQLKTVMGRWKFTGVGLVSDPLMPKVQFMGQFMG